MLMEYNDKHCGVGHNHDKNLRNIERPILSGNVVQHYIGKRSVRISIWNALVHHRERSRGQYEVHDHEEKRCNGKQVISHSLYSNVISIAIFIVRHLFRPELRVEQSLLIDFVMQRTIRALQQLLQ